MQGEIKPGDKILVMSTGRTHLVLDKVGVFTPKRTDLHDQLGAGEAPCINAVDQGRAWRAGGDTLTLPRACPAAEPLPGFQEMQAARCSRACIPVEADEYRGAARRAGEAAS